jgi:hypothetical protein
MWSIAGGVIAATIIWLIVSREWRLGGSHDLGSVSEQWVAEHRAHQAADRSG